MSVDLSTLIQRLNSLEESSKLAQVKAKEEMKKDLYFRLEETADIPRVQLSESQQRAFDWILKNSEAELDEDEYVIWTSTTEYCPKWDERLSHDLWLFLTNYGVIIYPKCGTRGIQRKRTPHELRLMLEILDGTVKNYCDRAKPGYYKQDSTLASEWKKVVSFISDYNSTMMPSDDYSDLLREEFWKYQQKIRSY